MSEYEEHWIETYTGKKFHYLKPTVDEIDIVDIAHSLALKTRFSGHCKTFYSVAEHSIRVAKLLPQELKLSGLLHDVAEAYIPDIPRPIKATFGLKPVEDKILQVIYAKYNTFPSPKIMEADDVLIATEARDLMENTDGWAKLPEPLKAKIVPVRWQTAELRFLIAFYLLTARA